jgi:2-methylcitrate dehydratase PrpD
MMRPIPGVNPVREKNLTRRSLFQRAGLALATSVFSPALAPDRGAASAAELKSSATPVMEKLSAYMGEASSRALPAEVTEKTKEHILDTLAAMISGSGLLPGRDAIEFVRGYGGAKVATVVASNVLCGPIEAALANGMLAHSDETDDEAPLGVHSGCAVIPATLAVGEQFGIDGTHFIRAVTLGYDLPPRLILAVGGPDVVSPVYRDYRPISAGFGAAAAAGCAAGLNARQMRWLLDYTAEQAAGLPAWRRDTQHIQKGFVFGGMNARSAVTSALLVRSGWTGVDDIFSGPGNFFAACAPETDPATLIDGLGQRYEVAQTNIKKWPVGFPLQAPLDALEALEKRRPFSAEEVKTVTVRIATRQAAMVNNRVMPDINLQHILALMLLHKTVTFRSANDEALMKDPVVLRERSKVELVPDEALQRLMPQREAIVDVTLTDGTRLSQRIEAVRGTTKNPMTRQEIRAKASDLITPVLGDGQSAKLIETVWALEKVKDIRELRPLLQRA